MSGDVVQAQYEQLDDLARRLEQQAEATGRMSAQVRRSMAALQQGGWVGKGSAAFTREMSHEVLPALQRLESALAEGKQTTLVISQIMRQAEEQAAQPFLQRGGSESPGSQAADGNGGSESIGSDGVSTIGDSFADRQRRASAVFQPDNMLRLVRETPTGAGNPRLNAAMERLLGSDKLTEQERDGLLKTIALERGRSFPEMKSDYERYLQLVGERRESVVPLYTFLHPNHLGSKESLRFGSAVGEVLGIDPVFGAMLNPTGGIMGPDNAEGMLLIQPQEGTPLSNHSIVHDAAGYLFAKHGLGPGYDYLGQEPQRDPRSALAGQVSGIRFWREHGRSISEGIQGYIGEAVMDGVNVRIGDPWHRATSTWNFVTEEVVGISKNVL